ncbi:MAG TPA: hypothetical protein VND94_06190 [Terriglobia bacterium]|nr:hypothetical protein [Terriglobia bacterium]
MQPLKSLAQRDEPAMPPLCAAAAWRRAALAATLPALLLVAGCAPQNSPPQQVEAQAPSVTYKYRGDQELLQANQNAMTYCSQFHSVAQTENIKNASDGSKTVIFRCSAMPPATVATTTTLGSNMAYPYRTDQELLEASRNADLYCQNRGSQRAVATVVTNLDGTKSVSFQCTP